MRNKTKLRIFLGAVLVLSSPAFAHHGAANYDTEKSVTLTGTVTDLQFTNPHVLVSVNVKDPSTGKVVEWRGELTSPNRLSRSGWSKSTLKPGDQVTLSGSPSKSGAPTMSIRELKKGDQEISTR